MIEDARVMFNSLQLWKVNHVRRGVKGAVHKLAKETLSLMDRQVRMEEGHLCVLNIVTAEYSNR